MDLLDFSDDKPPQLAGYKEKMPVPAPEMDGTAGFISETEDGTLVYVSQRNRDEHFFRKYEGYAVSKSILNILYKRGVKKVLIAEQQEGDVLEYRINDFAELSVPIEEEKDDPQLCVPEDQARRWENHVGNLTE